MYKKIVLFICFLIFCYGSIYADNSSVTVETRGTVNHSRVKVKKRPDMASRTVRTLYKNAKVVVIGEEGDWYKIKVNNVRNGYVLKKYIDFLSTLKKENKKVPYEKRRAILEVKALIERFNLNLIESMYYEKEKLVPNFAYMGSTINKKLFKVKIHYKVKNIVDKDSNINLPNPFQNVILSFIEVMFFKMMTYESDKYEIDIYVSSEDSDGMKEYAKLIYENDKNRFVDIKNNSGKIWKYIKSDTDKKELFKMYP
jgi:uncharacterized protein YgiM (DUF1202 family)